MNLPALCLAWIRVIKYRVLGRLTGKYSGLLYQKGNLFYFYRGNKIIKVRQKRDRLIYDRYQDWQLVQTQKGKQGDFKKLWQTTKFKQIKNWQFARLKQGEKMLEVGFRDGFNLKYLTHLGIKAQGIEVNRQAVNHAKSLHCQVYEEDIQEKTHYQNSTFDVISACDVLEHCFSPKSALKEIYRILRDNGRVVIEIPFEQEFGNNLTDGHSTLFQNENQFEKIANACGFDIIKKNLSNPERNIFLLTKQANKNKPKLAKNS